MPPTTTQQPRAFAAAAAAFLDHRDLADTTTSAYTETFRRVAAELGNPPLDRIEADHLANTLDHLWGNLAPGTYNRHRAALASLWTLATEHGWTDHNPTHRIPTRQTRPPDSTNAIALALLHDIWTNPDHALRERTMWVMLYETLATATEVLDLNIDHLDLPGRTATLNRERIWWNKTTAIHLDRHLANRRTGPVFVAARRPTNPTGPSDIDPDTGRGRLSYRRAAELFSDASRGHTLRDLRHAAMTHLHDAGIHETIIQAKTRHKSARSLDRYTTTPGNPAPYDK